MTRPAGASRFHMQITALAGKPHVSFLRSKLRRARAMIDVKRRAPLRDLSLVMVDDARMAALHKRFMGIASPTDVLTFPIDLDVRGRAMSGEVVVCVPEARRRARELGTGVAHELLLYALHGMLHLCGFDDRTARAFDRMHQMEDTILSRLGVGPVFDPTSRQPRRKSGRPRRR